MTWIYDIMNMVIIVSVNEEKVQMLVSYLKERKETIATMESCTGGGLANAITNVLGASEVFSFGAVTYSNAAKIMMGVEEAVIETYTVYSKEVAYAMAKHICDKAAANYGIGITGKINDQHDDSIVYLCIYDKQKNDAFYQTASVNMNKRQDNKNILINLIVDCFFAFVASSS